MRPDTLLPLSALALLASAGLNASAGTYFDKYEATADTVNAASVATLPLLALNNSVTPVVAVVFGDGREGLAALSFGSRNITISEDLAKELKLKVKTADKKSVTGEGKRTTLPKLSLGEVSLSEVTVAVTPLGLINGLPVDAVIGLGGVEDQLAWAILPSQGVVKVGPASSGASLVAELGGTALAYRSEDSAIVKGKAGHYKPKRGDHARPFIVQATVGGQPVDAFLGSLEPVGCSLASDLVPADAPREVAGDQTWVWVASSLGDSAPTGAWYLASGLYDTEVLTPPTWRASLCPAVTAGYDLAIDPVAHKIGLKPAGLADRGERKVGVAEDALLARLKKATEPPAEDPSKAADEKAKDDKDAGDKKKDDAGPWLALGEGAASMNRLDEALSAYKRATELDPASCDAWIGLGSTQLRRGALAEATTALGVAAGLSHAWWDLSLDERDDVVKAQKKLEGEALKAAEPHQQPASCTAADGLLAQAALASGDQAALEKLYKERLDLDPAVALAAGVHALLVQDWTAAEGAWRQAIKREALGSPDLRPRLGLALGNAAQGNAEAAVPQLGDALLLDDTDWMTVYHYVNTMQTFFGAEKAREIARKWADDRPDSLGPALESLRLAQAGGDAAAIDAALKHAQAVAARPFFREAPATRTALKARLAFLTGDASAAEATAKDALERNPNESLAWLVLMDVAGTRYDDKAFLKARDQAVLGDLLHPGWAQLRLAAPPVKPPPPPEPEPVVEEPPPPPKKGKK